MSRLLRGPPRKIVISSTVFAAQVREVPMLLREMNSAECKEFLANARLGRLACAKDNQPYILPIYFAFDNDILFGFSTLGKKIEWMRENSRICIEADQVRSQNFWDSVIVFGQYQELPDTPEWAEQRRHAQLVLEKRALWWQTSYAASQARDGGNAAEPIFYCIHIDEITGRSARPDEVEAGLKDTRENSRRSLH